MNEKVKFVYLESGAFLSDPDFQRMTAEQRGIYCTIIFYLYTNGGKLAIKEEANLAGMSQIAALSNCFRSGQEWKGVWELVSRKFQIKNGILTHKRVTKELTAAQAKKTAGLIAASARWEKDAVAMRSQCGRNTKAMRSQCQPNAKQGKAKQTNTNKNIDKSNTNSVSANEVVEKHAKELLGVGSPEQLLELDCRIAEDKKILEGFIQTVMHPVAGEIATFRGAVKWLVHVAQTQPDRQGILKDACEWVKRSKIEAQKPKAYFIHLVKKNSGWKKEIPVKTVAGFNQR